MPILNWIGKDKVINSHTDVEYSPLNLEYSFKGGKDSKLEFENKIIHGDNLLGLKSLLPQYQNKIKCIYIDPPYNTGNENWIYNDNVNDPKIKKWLGTVVGKESEDLSRHDKWLCMMYPRLVLLRELLAEDGAIFISIDDNEQANLKLIMDEIFGGVNFVANVIWQKKFSPQNDAKYFSDNHDFILCYTKNKFIWDRNLLGRTEMQDSRYKNIDNDPRGVWTSSDLTVKRETAKDIYPVISPSGIEHYPTKGRSFSISKTKFIELNNENRIWWGENGSNMPRLKRFLTDVQQGTVPLTIWTHAEVGHNQSAKQELKKIFPELNSPFETPKPPTLIEKILQLSTDSNSIILDSFAGSGTTAHTVLNLNKQDGGNRKFILLEMEDYANSITAERVKRVINGYGEGNSKVEATGGEFSYYTLGESLFVDNFLNPKVSLDKIREYIYFTETKEKILLDKNVDNKYFLGQKDSTAYYFYFEHNKDLTLDFSFLKTIKTKADSYIIYAENSILSKEFLQEKKIIFKQIPTEIYKV